MESRVSWMMTLDANIVRDNVVTLVHSKLHGCAKQGYPQQHRLRKAVR